MRKDAKARLAALAAAQAAKPATPPPDQIAWNLVKDSTDADALRRFVAQYPNSAETADAEKRIASLSAAPANAVAVSQPDPHELARSLQFELQRVGCFIGTVNGEFDDATKAALHKFIKLTSNNLPDEATPDAINAVRGVDKRICPLLCPHGQHAEGEQCVANPPPPPKQTASEAASAPERPAQAIPSPGFGGGRPCRNLRMHRLPTGGCGY